MDAEIFCPGSAQEATCAHVGRQEQLGCRRSETQGKGEGCAPPGVGARKSASRTGEREGASGRGFERRLTSRSASNQTHVSSITDLAVAGARPKSQLYSTIGTVRLPRRGPPPTAQPALSSSQRLGSSLQDVREWQVSRRR